MLESSSKLMYYPTDQHEIYRMLGIVGRLSITADKRNQVRNDIGDQAYFKLLEDGINNYRSSFATSVYNYFLERKQYDKLHKYIELSIGFSHNDTITIFDPFAGEGVWLEMFKKTLPRDHINSAKIHLIANELEQSRYNTIKEKNIVDEVYNKAYEELNDIPKKSVSMLLYNPPYGDSNGVRNVLHYLEMIIEEEIIYRSNSYNNENGKIIMVIRKDDLLLSLPLLTKHFKVDEERIYKVNDKEYGRYKQFVIYAELRYNPYNDNNVNDVLKHQQEIERITKIIESNPKFNLGMYDTYSMRPPAVPYERLKENHKIVQENQFEISVTNGDSWNWLKEMTETKDIENEVINKPVPVKLAELANIIASGMVNGEMSLDNGQGYHIVAGGTKEQMQQEVIQEKNRNGKLENKTKTVLYTQPYLNILINDNGKIKIKELQGGTDIE